MELKEIPGTLGFLADKQGNIYNSNGTKRNTYHNGDGYVTVCVKIIDGRWITFGVQRLIALTWLSDKQTELCNEVNHRDGDLENNDVSNLEWVTSSQNNIHSEIMRLDNQYCSVLVKKNDITHCLCKNANEAAISTGVEILDIWDSIKDNKTVSEWSFHHQPFSGRVPEHLKRYGNNTGVATAIKMLDIDTGDVREFKSFAEAAIEFETSPSHVYQSVAFNGKVKLFRKKYQVVMAMDDFPVISLEDLEIARNHGPKETIAYNFVDEQYVIFDNAKKFIEHSGLSKKAITTSLAGNRLRRIGSWVALYLTTENVERLKAYVRSPVHP